MQLRAVRNSAVTFRGIDSTSPIAASIIGRNGTERVHLSSRRSREDFSACRKGLIPAFCFIPLAGNGARILTQRDHHLRLTPVGLDRFHDITRFIEAWVVALVSKYVRRFPPAV